MKDSKNIYFIEMFFESLICAVLCLFSNKEGFSLP